MRAPFFVTAATGTADLLAAELVALGIENVCEVLGGVACEGELAAAYRACLESRVGLRVLWEIGRFPASDAEGLYDGVRTIDWSAHLAVEGTLAVDFSGSLTGITHTQFGAQRVKDAVVDQFRERTDSRPLPTTSLEAEGNCPKAPERCPDGTGTLSGPIRIAVRMPPESCPAISGTLSDITAAGPRSRGRARAQASSSNRWVSNPARHVHSQRPGSSAGAKTGKAGVRTRDGGEGSGVGAGCSGRRGTGRRRGPGLCRE